MSTRWQLSRRTVLRGLGTLVALPVLEQMLPNLARAQSLGAAPVRRLVVVFVPCGIHMEDWTPQEEGPHYLAPRILSPLEPFREQTLVVSGLANRPAYPDGSAPHVGGTGSFLTARTVAAGGVLRNGISMDQVAARHVGPYTRFPSLQLGLDGGATGTCELDFSCAYFSNISWASESTPLAKEIHPQAVFDRMFGDFGQSPAALARRRRYQLSVLDFVREDAQQLKARLGRADQVRLDEYLTGVRELELRLNQLGSGRSCTPGAAPAAPTDMEKHTRAMLDLITLAFQCDQTRVVTFMMGNGASARPFPFLGLGGQHHQLSHHQNNPSKIEAIVKINTWETTQLAYLLEKMQRLTEPDGSTQLDNSVVLFSSEMGDGNTHDRTHMPVLLAGRCGGQLSPGRHLRLSSEQPIAKLYVSLLGMVGAPVKSFGLDGDGPLAGLGA